MFFRPSPQNQQGEYFVYHFKGQPIVALPVAGDRLRRAGVARYPIYSFKRRIFRRVLQAAIFLRIDRFWSRRSTLPGEFVGNLDFPAFMDHLEAELKQGKLYPVVHRPPQEGRQRLYIHLLDLSGKPVAFVKVALDDLNNEQLGREASSLSQFLAQPPVGFNVPALLGDGEFEGHRYLLLDPQPKGVSAAALAWETLGERFNRLMGPPEILDAEQARQTRWWKNYESASSLLPAAYNQELRELIGRGLPVGRVHGDLGVNNLALAEKRLWVIDWEESCDVGPRKTDEIGHYLSTNQRSIFRNPRRAAKLFARKFLEAVPEDEWRDVMAALAFHYAAPRDTAAKILECWPVVVATAKRPRPLDAVAECLQSLSHVAIISNEPTPYRVHVLNRLAAEMNDVRIHNIFTHTISKPSMPWEMQIGPQVNPVFFPRQHLTLNNPVSVRSVPLFRKIRKFLVEQDVKLVVLLGYNDLTRLLLIRWARRRKLPVLLAGDSNVFSEGRVSARVRPIKRRYLHWVLDSIAGLMPMGTCGRAFFRVYRDHDLPEFLFPYEPDYDSLGRVSRDRLEKFQARHGLTASRKRFLICGRLAPVKRVEIAIEAFIRLAYHLPDWDLVIVGDGPLRAELEDMVPESLQSRVKFLGFLQFGDTAACYRACQVLVHTSEYEPWGLVINEAVASGLAVIATGVTGAAVELVRHRENGLIISPGSVESLIEAMMEVTERDDYKRMQAAAPGVLAAWRDAADPVEGFRKAVIHFGIVHAPAIPEKHAEDSADSNADISPQHENEVAHAEFAAY